MRAPHARRVRVALALPLVLAGAGCRGSATDPAPPPVGPVPSELAVSFQTSPAAAPGGTTITGGGDSVVAAAVLPGACDGYRARAGVAGGVLVITLIDRVTDQVCTLAATRVAVRAVVRPAPRGRYDAALRLRVEAPPRSPAVTELVRRAVAVP